MKTLENPEDVSMVRARIHELTSEDSANWGVMNVTQMVCHLRGPYHFALSTGLAQHISLPIPAAAAKYMALRSPLPWPKGLPTLPEFKINGECMKAVSFVEDRATLIDVFDRFCAFPKFTKDHPFFATMAHADWMRWGYLHADHHLRQFGR